MTRLTTQEKRVLLFIAFIFALGMSVKMFQKATGCNFCLIDVYSSAPGARSVDVNSATREELISVPGIGEKTADAIVRLRAEKGRIIDLKELIVINGISERKLETFKKHLTLREEQ